MGIEKYIEQLRNRRQNMDNEGTILYMIRIET